MTWPPPDAGPPPRRPGHTRQRIAAETAAMRAGWRWSPRLRAWVHPDRPGETRTLAQVADLAEPG